MTTVSRLTGFVSIVVLAGALGDGVLADAYNLANTMPNMLFELLIGGVLTSVFVPVFVEQLLEREGSAWLTAANFINVALVILGLVAVVGTVFSYYFVRLQTFLVSGTSPSVELASFFFKFFVWEILFYASAGIINGILQSVRRFATPAMAPIFNNLVVIATVAAVYLPLRQTSPTLALYALAVGTTFGIVAMTLAQLPALRSQGYRHRWVFDLRDPALRKLFALSLPVIGYVASNQVALTVSNVLAYQFRGGMTAFVYAWRFFQLPYGIISVSIATVLFTGIAEAASKGEMGVFKKRFSQGMRATGFIIIPVSVLMFILSRQIIWTTLRHGNFTALGANTTAEVLAYFVLGLLPFSAFIFLARMFYALHDTVTPLKINAIGIPINIVLDVILVRFFQVPGLSMGHSLTYVVTSILMLRALRSRVGPLGIREITGALSKFALLSVAMGAIILGVLFALGLEAPSAFWPSAEAVLIGGVLGVAIYLAGSYVSRFPELKVVDDLLANLLKRRQERR